MRRLSPEARRHLGVTVKRLAVAEWHVWFEAWTHIHAVGVAVVVYVLVLRGRGTPEPPFRRVHLVWLTRLARAQCQGMRQTRLVEDVAVPLDSWQGDQGCQ